MLSIWSRQTFCCLVKSHRYKESWDKNKKKTKTNTNMEERF